eukprot:bmy_02735T0
MTSPLPNTHIYPSSDLTALGPASAFHVSPGGPKMPSLPPCHPVDPQGQNLLLTHHSRLSPKEHPRSRIPWVVSGTLGTGVSSAQCWAGAFADVTQGKKVCERQFQLSRLNPEEGDKRGRGLPPGGSLGRTNSDPYEWSVQFGELSATPSIWNLQAYYNRYNVEQIFLSPRYLGSASYDIALLKLSSSITYTKYIQPICLMASSSEFENRTDCWVTGWGDIEEDQAALPSPYTLQEVQVGIINTTMCNHLFSLPDFRRDIWGDMVCAGDPQGGKDSCFVGIVSRGVGCGRPNRPGVYTNISAHYKWIRTVLAKNTICRPDPCPLLLLFPLLWAPPFLQLA